jgi:hypothetical protein
MEASWLVWAGVCVPSVLPSCTDVCAWYSDNEAFTGGSCSGSSPVASPKSPVCMCVCVYVYVCMCVCMCVCVCDGRVLTCGNLQLESVFLLSPFLS